MARISRENLKFLQARQNCKMQRRLVSELLIVALLASTCATSERAQLQTTISAQTSSVDELRRSAVVWINSLSSDCLRQFTEQLPQFTCNVGPVAARSVNVELSSPVDDTAAGPELRAVEVQLHDDPARDSLTQFFIATGGPTWR